MSKREINELLEKNTSLYSESESLLEIRLKLNEWQKELIEQERKLNERRDDIRRQNDSLYDERIKLEKEKATVAEQKEKNRQKADELTIIQQDLKSRSENLRQKERAQEALELSQNTRFIIEGFVIALLVGVLVNQITDIISHFKDGTEWTTTLWISVGIFIVLLVFFLIKLLLASQTQK